ncbi:uncharacterized protein L969DRAFT_538472 [Mixia osmundae IAM 14324]|uniref:Nucleotide-diphospho-sugar transferase domain-containing protein n=1 Tax=Mixia osmundae (strain CBS 9802 / IAM 14324 / JCM 22182 / KY 12970) TaxID=764103 RepID=G7E7U3_MIXOS|nr:uncharacterized protein L969DRAFT_538472 [Mixia osmundae IAM 14324]KEI38504.1 hypothetical protein L969DRAFT_538472 [Mixia osmundae IAM 14324]GAA98903.1 hypothetical protein E5Q_05591 [Mixia osmundae IAM 14324]
MVLRQLGWYRLALLASVVAIALFTLHGERDEEEDHLPLQTVQYNSARPGRHLHLPTATGINDSLSLSTFLRQRIGKLPKDDYLWVTLLDATYLRQGGTDLTLFLQRLGDGTLPRAPGRVRPTTDVSSIDMYRAKIDDGDIDFDEALYNSPRGHQDLLVICLDQACVDLCNERNLFGYGGFYQPARQWPSKPPLMMTKLLAFKEIAEAGYRTLFVEGDVWLRYDPYPYLPKWTDEGFGISFPYEGSAEVNIGVIVSSGDNDKVAELWRRALDDMINRVGQWDQGAVNKVLELTYDNYTVGAHERKKATPWGLGVHFLDRFRFVQYHRGYGVPAEAVLLHTTCVDDYPIRRTLAATHGFTQDIDSYYSKPRKILSLDALTGTEAGLQGFLAIAVGLAADSGRDLLLPPTALYLNTSVQPNLRNRDIWAVLPIEETSQEYNVDILEPRYLSHAHTNSHRDTLVLDIQLRPTYTQLVDALNSPLYDAAGTVALSLGAMPTAPMFNWRDVPAQYKRLKLCYDLWRTPGCDISCLREPLEDRQARLAAKRRQEPWAMLKPVLYPKGL